MRRACMIILMVLMTALLPVAAGALEFPHNADISQNKNFKCNQCHLTGRSAGLKRFENFCYNCHAGNPSVRPKHTVTVGDSSNVFYSITTNKFKNLTEAGKTMTSHNWVGLDNKPAAGSVSPTSGPLYKSAINGTVSCARCHWVHSTGAAYQQNKPLLRMANDQDQLCVECHKPRNTRKHMDGTHPVQFNYYSSLAIRGTSWMYSNPVNNKPANPTANLQNYLKKNRVVCSTCHGVHKTDSNSDTYDSYTTSTMSPPATIANGKGMLLRTELRRPTAAEPNICQNCHSYANHQNVQCTHCHEGHVTTDFRGNLAATPVNGWIIARYINYSAVVTGSSKNVRDKAIFFNTTSGTNKSYYYTNLAGTALATDGKDPLQERYAICQVCHTVPDQTIDQHKLADELAKGDRGCKSCHKHIDGGFKAGGLICGVCHGRPPMRRGSGNKKYGGLEGGFAVFTTGTAVNYNYSTAQKGGVKIYKYESATPHNRHSEGAYGIAPPYYNYYLSCDECHKGNNHITKTYQDVYLAPATNFPKLHPRPGDTRKTDPVASYFAKNFARYTSANRTDGTCSNTYCHSNGAPRRTTLNIYTGMVYRWPAQKVWAGGKGKISAAAGNRCTACHNYKTAAGFYNLSTGSHYKHFMVNSGNPMMSSPIICNACHKSSLSQSNYTTINYEGKLHVNGYKDMAFAVPYGGMNWTESSGTCSAACHSNGVNATGGNFGRYTTAKWGISVAPANRCGLCHAFPPATGAHLKHMPSDTSRLHQSYTSVGVWSVGPPTGNDYVFGCANCHPKDINKHIDGYVDVTLNKNHGGLLKSKNSNANDDASGWSKNAGKLYCFASYCHSNGANGVSAAFKFYTSPDWYGTFTSDKCAMCHGNSPNSGGKVGSPAHYNNNTMGTGKTGGHFVGVHYADIYISSGGNGKATPGNTAFGSHGNPSTATTISCSTCHFSAVTSSANDNNVMCISCHTGGAAQNPAELIANKNVHLNGAIDVALNPIQVKAKAQLRNASFDRYSLVTWKRYPGAASYKESGAYDQGKAQLLTAAMWSGGSCLNIACHNGETIPWNTTINSCVACHTKL